ncbi:hypothetical protein H4W00_001889 [Psychrobacter sp. PL19]|uniref:hypothetical protein n=1 Tax=Psychrobacter sp. PL19 TaxID=2760711 RepID=UPI001AE47065
MTNPFANKPSSHTSLHPDDVDNHRSFDNTIEKKALKQWRWFGLFLLIYLVYSSSIYC